MNKINKALSSAGHGLLGLSLSVLGVALSPQVLGILSPKVALGVTLAGIAYQSLTGKALQIAQPDAPVAPAPVVPVAVQSSPAAPQSLPVPSVQTSAAPIA